MALIRAKQALLPDGWASDVRVEIDAVGKISKVTAGDDGTDVQDGDHHVGILLPAVVNVHSHAFQRAMAGLSEQRGRGKADSFWTWRKLMFRFLEQLTPDHVEAIAAFVQMEMLESGYATNVEFHYLHHRPDGAPYGVISEMAGRIVAASDTTGIGLTLLPVQYQYGGCDGRDLGAGQIRFGNNLGQFMRLWEDAGRTLSGGPGDAVIGMAAHSLRAVAPGDILAMLAQNGSRPFHIHLAEQPGEVAEVSAVWGQRPVEWLLDNAPVDERWCLIHCTQMQPHETRALATTGAVAGLCPITESNLGDGIFDGLRWLDGQGKIAIGSDSNIRISLSEELRTLEYSQRLRDGSRAALASSEKSTGRRLFDEVCAGGAQAAGRYSGSISPGAWADLMVLDADHADLMGRDGDTVLDSYIFAGDDRMVRDVWSAGRHVVKDGQHIRRQSILSKFRQVMKNLSGAM